MTLTIGQVLEAAAERLAPSPTARADAEELVGRLLGRKRAELYLERATPLDASAERRLEAWISRRLAGDPVQYITGRAAFRGLDLEVSPAVLIPRPETEVLVEVALEALRAEAGRWPSPRVLDLGTGSGAIALAIAAEYPAARVTAVERSPAALEIAHRNAEALGLAGRVRFVEGYWFDAPDADERFEMVVSNPPYVSPAERDELPADVRDHEPAEALFSGEDGLEDTREILDRAPRHLVAAGRLLLELSERRAAEVAAWLEGSRDWAEVAVRNDLAGKPRILVAIRERGPAIAPAQWIEE